MEGQYYTVKQVAHHLNMTERYVQAEIKRGRLHANRFGREYRISPEDLQAYKQLTHTTSEQQQGAEEGAESEDVEDVDESELVGV